MAKLIFGCGYFGSRVAQSWVKSGETVYAVTRTESRATELRSDGIQPLVLDITQTQPHESITVPNVSTVLFAVGFDRTVGKTIRDVYVDGLNRALNVMRSFPERLIYVSSTGVYGQTAAEWVDESSVCRPTREGGKACLDAEKLLSQSRLGNRSIVLRLAGIYGPDRLPRLEELKKGRPLACASRGWLNLIHVDDAVQAVLQAEQRANPPAIYLVADGNPVPRREFYEEVARAMRLSKPCFVEPPTDSHVTQRASADKRISNRRLVNDLQVKLRYPSFREGVKAIIAGNNKC